MRKLRTICVASALLFFAVPLSVRALTIFSPVLELTGEPGETLEGVLKVYNESDESVVVVSSIQAYEATTQTGAPIYDAQADQLPHVDWFSIIDDQHTIEPAQVILVPFRITIPTDATPGGYYATVFWTATPESLADDPTTSIVRERLGNQLLITVLGDTAESGIVEAVNILPDSTVLFGLPDRATVVLHNTGNVHLKPQGSIELSSAFGRTEQWQLSEKIVAVLPGMTRQFDVQLYQRSQESALTRLWSDISSELQLVALGPVTITTHITAGTNSEVDQLIESTVYVVPVRLLGVLVGLLLLIIVVFLIRKRALTIKKKIREN